MTTMTIEQVKQARKELEDKLITAIALFEAETRCVVSSLILTSRTLVGGDKGTVRVDVEIEVGR